MKYYLISVTKWLDNGKMEHLTHETASIDSVLTLVRAALEGEADDVMIEHVEGEPRVVS